jgi:ArsR family transcriptional regulator
MRGPGEAARVSAPLCQLKAEFFKTLGHPARIRVLDLLSDREHAVAEMLPLVGIEPAHLSQLAVLRRANLVTSRSAAGSGAAHRPVPARLQPARAGTANAATTLVLAWAQQASLPLSPGVPTTCATPPCPSG